MATNICNPNRCEDLHIWAEVEMCGWVHVDPVGNTWANKTQYEELDWGRYIGSTVRIYAFKNGKCEEVTSNYFSQS